MLTELYIYLLLLLCSHACIPCAHRNVVVAGPTRPRTMVDDFFICVTVAKSGQVGRQDQNPFARNLVFSQTLLFVRIERRDSRGTSGIHDKQEKCICCKHSAGN